MVNQRTILIIFTFIFAAILAAFMFYTYKNMELMKSSPLEYAEKKLGGSCECYCLKNGMLTAMYATGNKTYDRTLKYAINFSLLEDSLVNDG